VKKKRFSVEQITAVLRQGGGRRPVGDVYRTVAISEQTFYRRKKSYASMLAKPASLKQLREEKHGQQITYNCHPTGRR
jgi:putative transposase